MDRSRSRRSLTGYALAVIVAVQATQASAVASAEDAASPACTAHEATRRAFFGDLHIHTGLSADAMLFGTTNRPDDAYAFARGREIELSQRMVVPQRLQARLERPLDFAAVTDHAENIGAVSLCTSPDSPVYDSDDCRYVRRPLPNDSMASFSAELAKVFQRMYSSEAICGPDHQRCEAAVAAPWQEIQRAANAWNNACNFTTFIGYEYSPTERGANLHHNVIFASDRATRVPISSRDVPDPFAFYERLKAECNEAGTGCKAIAIPHNSNISNGRMFRPGYAPQASTAERRAVAETRADMVRLVEIFQEKGDSECRNGLWNVLGRSDEFCDFEKYRDWQGATHEDCKDGVGAGGFQNQGCVSRSDYVRYALALGLAEENRIGSNPMRFGFVAATDNHLGTTADLEEWVHDGEQRPVSLIEPGRMSTGGLTGIWAEENTRGSLYGAMERREVFATSGPRIQPRLFAGWDLPADLCEAPNMLARAYASGVPMGARLEGRPGASSGPVFLASALKDPGIPARPGTPLQRLQVVKVWAGDGDAVHQAVFDVAGGANGATVDAETCEQSTAGAVSLCATWRDPDYAPDVPAAYYLRVLEDPSCRHTGYACARARARGKGGPEYCDDESMPKVIQERAWTSPIWVDAGR